jgi:hypothetical protein
VDKGPKGGGSISSRKSILTDVLGIVLRRRLGLRVDGVRMIFNTSQGMTST